MISFAAVLPGALFGLGLILAYRALTVYRDEDVIDLDAARVERREHTALRDRFDRLGLRCGLALGGAVAIGMLTGWPVGIILAAAGGFMAPSMLGARARRALEQARLDAIATWTEQLRDVMAAAAGLEQGIVATASHAPPAIRSDVVWLAATLEAGTSMRTALRRFAQRLDDPAGDLVIAALILAAEGSPRQLGDLLGRLAVTTREAVKMRLRVETGRARTRSAVRVVTLVTIVFSTGIVVFNPAYVEEYRQPAGQFVLVVVAAFFGGAYWWLAHASQSHDTARFLTAGGAPTHVRTSEGAAR